MREFIFKANKTITSSNINLKDLPGSCGRLDLVCRCVSSAFFLSHDIRRDVVFYAVFYGEPNPPVAIKFVGGELKKVSPDERNIAIFIKKALKKFEETPENKRTEWIESTPGICVSKKEFREIILEKKNEGKRILYLHKAGEDFENVKIGENEDVVFILGDHIGIGEEDEDFLEDIGAEKVSLSPLELHADHCIVIVHNILDKRFK
ncbi:tRNA (pseudouridine(54)-N(1))-methyltransferase TrmY [Methanotorris formicicus]|uniref:tRNA (pseudouridine(54)-N(1))-methyltransferase TrmY n=1 Tax=Methanotorris formicicus TaxID=213185 RepID=UPI00064F7EFD|nr:tRNA (pseudouridine(54)-N(1))-methyltransferase TrmY [Methanotorris formicicus]